MRDIDRLAHDAHFAGLKKAADLHARRYAERQPADPAHHGDGGRRATAWPKRWPPKSGAKLGVSRQRYLSAAVTRLSILKPAAEVVLIISLLKQKQ
jgi:hypothetical protein